MEAQATRHGVTFRLDLPGSGPDNMAADLALLESGQNVCRLYSWSGPWISLGRFQHPERVLRSSEVPFVMRPTGGKAVLHGHDWTIGWIAPYTSLLQAGEDVEDIRRSVKTVYRRLMTPIIQALRNCNLPAVLGENSRFVSGIGHTGDCFAHVAGCDVVHEDLGLKLCGSALRLDQDAALLQASIPKAKSLVDPSDCFIDGNSQTSLSWDHENFPEALRVVLT